MVTSVRASAAAGAAGAAVAAWAGTSRAAATARVLSGFISRVDLKVFSFGEGSERG